MKFESKYHLVIDEIAFEKVVCEIVAILSSGGGGAFITAFNWVSEIIVHLAQGQYWCLFAVTLYNTHLNH